jgi:sugar O-acyltransferase (sialic acid O-acetyltransferase NeuD family)
MPERIQPIYLIGAGGHAKVVADILIASGCPPTAVLDDDPKQATLLGLSVFSTATPPSPDGRVIVAIGDNYVRERITLRYNQFGTAIHPSAQIGRDVEIGDGSVIMAGAVINPGSRIGRHCIVNTRASVDHDCVLEDFAHVAPGATLGGRVRVGRGTMVSLGASVIHGLVIGEYTVVGAGAIVVRDLPSGVIAYGVPARVVRNRSPDEPYL